MPPECSTALTTPSSPPAESSKVRLVIVSIATVPEVDAVFPCASIASTEMLRSYSPCTITPASTASDHSDPVTTASYVTSPKVTVTVEPASTVPVRANPSDSSTRLISPFVSTMLVSIVTLATVSITSVSVDVVVPPSLVSVTVTSSSYSPPATSSCVNLAVQSPSSSVAMSLVTSPTVIVPDVFGVPVPPISTPST